MRSCLPLFAAFLLLPSQRAAADPIAIEATLAATGPRTDANTGVCGTGVHLNVSDRFNSIDLARGFLESSGNAQINARNSSYYPVVNFKNSLSTAGGDFTGQASNESGFPFSLTSANATQPNDNNNFAFRVRGYLNILNDGVHADGTYTFAVNADDAYQFLIAGKEISKTTNLVAQVSLRDARQVKFAAPGLYPFEIVYYQNSGPAVLELSVSDRSGDTEFTSSNMAIGANFKLAGDAVGASMGKLLYSALGSRAQDSTGKSCTECTAANATACGTGSFCRDGLCQRCAIATRCGSDCSTCPNERPVCTDEKTPAASSCVECGLTINGEINDASCKAQHKICDFAAHQCVPCLGDAQCDQAGGEICDIPNGQCIPRPNVKYAGGCNATGSPDLTAAMGLLLLAIGGLFLRRLGARRA